MIDPITITLLITTFATLLSQIFGHIKKSSCGCGCLKVDVESEKLIDHPK
jgi:hypothetical protein